MSRPQRLTLIATILGSTVVFLDATVVNVALPAISDDLDAGLAGQQWVVEAYLLALVALILVGGSLGDQFGRRRIFVDRPGRLRGHLGALRDRADRRVPDRRPRAAGDRRGAAGAGLAGDRRRHLRGRGARQGGRHLDRLDRDRDRVRPGRRRRPDRRLSWRAIFWVNLPLIAVTVCLTLRAVEETRDPDAYRGIDWLGIVLSAVGLGGPVFALIEQPTHGWGDPLVWVPLIAGVLCFAAFLLYEARARHPMLDLGLFRIRNFAVANVTTLAVYAGLMRRPPLRHPLPAAGRRLLGARGGAGDDPDLDPALRPLAALRPARLGHRAAAADDGRAADRRRLGLLLLLRVGSDASYLADVLPAVIVFGLGLSATVAPLTATVLDSVAERRVGIASGINNGVSRVAGLLAIAVLGAVISAQFGSVLDSKLGDSAPLSPATEKTIAEAKEQPLAVPDTDDLAAGGGAAGPRRGDRRRRPRPSTSASCSRRC